MTQIRLHKGGKPITDIETWFSYAPPKKGALHWKDGYSAKEFARSFFSSSGGQGEPPGPPTLPAELEALLATRFNPPFEVEGEPERVVRIDALKGEHPNLDLAAVVSHSSGVVALAIEAKVEEPFGSIIGEKLAPKTGKAPSPGTSARISALREALCQSVDESSFLKLRYQLLYGVAAALCHAKAQGCPAAIYVAHTVGRPSAEKWTDNQKAYCDLLSALGAASPDRIYEGELFGPVTVNGNDYIPKDVELYVGKVSRSPVSTGSHPDLDTASPKAAPRPVINVDADPDNADWIRILRAERIARQVPGGKQIWEAALEEAGGSRSSALMVFYRLLREAGIEEPD